MKKLNLAPVVLVLTSCIAGCGSLGWGRDDDEEAGSVAAAAFADPNLAVASWGREPAPDRPVMQAPESSADVMVLTAMPGVPDLPAAGAGTPGEQSAVEGLVGFINGRPVYASRILDEIGPRLRSLALELKDAAKWRIESAKVIHKQLEDQVRDELLLAEARQSLTPEQKQGLIHFLEDIQSRAISAEGGSRERAEERLLAESGQNLDRAAQESLDKQLIAKQLRDRILSRVNVSWRDVELEYERNSDLYNPAAVAILRMVWVPTEETDNVNAVAAKIAAGESFRSIAELPINQFNRGEAGLHKSEFRGDFASADNKHFNPAELDAAVRGITVGQTTSPISFRIFTAWIHFEEIQQPPSRSLYDVQLEVYNKLRSQRIDAEASRYIAALSKSGSFTEIEEMTARLLEVAIERFGDVAEQAERDARTR